MSSYGHIETMARAVAEGAREVGAQVDIKCVPELVPEEIARKAHYKLDQAAPIAKVEKGAVGGVQGVWVRPAHARPHEAILYLHRGWFNFGSAWAYRSFVEYIAKRARKCVHPGLSACSEHPFPAAIDDALASYRGLGTQGVRGIAVVGDSAGGNLTLAFASRVIGDANWTPATLVGALACHRPHSIRRELRNASRSRSSFYPPASRGPRGGLFGRRRSEASGGVAAPS